VDPPFVDHELYGNEAGMDEEMPVRSPLRVSRGDDADAPEPLWDTNNVAVERVEIDVLLPADSPRVHGQDDEHIRRLVGSDAQLPPIIVHRSTMRVIDGMHRLRAAQARGNTVIDVRFFDGSAVDAFAVAVQSNVMHGLPLTRDDRTTAAKRLIAECPSWSDRLIASVSGLSARTVRTLRRESGTASVVAARIGRDGRRRPVDPVAGRMAASRIVSERPDAPLREIARKAGISPMTAQDVRDRIRRGEDPIPAQHHPRTRPAPRSDAGRQAPDADIRGQSGPTPCASRPTADQSLATSDRLARGARGSQKPDIATVLDNLVRDPSLRFTDSGRTLLQWLTRHSAALPRWADLAPTVPSHCTYIIAGLARQCADEWRNFADELTKRIDNAG
jgi:ParB-like chromosome segregation protein Spo0J